MARFWIILGGVLAIVSLSLTWWFSYYSTVSFQSLNPMISLLGNSSRLIYNISPIEEAGSPGVPINYTTFGINYSRCAFLIPVVILLVIIGGLLGIASGIISPKSVLYEVCAGIVVLAAVSVFVFVLIYTAGVSLLAGTMNVFGTTASWGLGPGLFVALISAFVMILGHRFKSKRTI